ncbi:MAG: MbnP family protein, partial [Bacteroidia bacterium]
LRCLLFSCKKDPTPVPVVPTGSVSIMMKNVADTSDLVLNTKNYINQHGDTFKVNTYKYYISNVKLTRNDGTVFSESESYHLIDASKPASCSFRINGLREGSYTSVSFMIGVDSLHNVSGAQSGDLDPLKGMFWDWTSGYIMAWMDGTSPQSPAVANKIVFQATGFSGPNSVLKTVNLSFGTNLVSVAKDHNSSLTISSDVMEWFKTPAIVNFSTTYLVGNPGPASRAIADNYADMFKIVSVNN